jgi:mono/diheme cytochrome c family protein
MKKRNIPIIVLIIVGFILIVISCSRSQAQGLPADQPAAQVDQAADDHAEAEAEHQETDDTHMDDHGHGPEEHMAGSHGVPDEAAAVENPVPATDESVAAGAAVFAQNCAVCHGENGEGDGPLAETLDKQPANLHESHVQDLSDGALFWIITHGRPETPMPPWDNVLSETDRWNEVNFLRTFDDGGTEEHEEDHDHSADVEEDHHADETEEENIEQNDHAHDEDAEGHAHDEGDDHAHD